MHTRTHKNNRRTTVGSSTPCPVRKVRTTSPCALRSWRCHAVPATLRGRATASEPPRGVPGPIFWGGRVRWDPKSACSLKPPRGWTFPEDLRFNPSPNLGAAGSHRGGAWRLGSTWRSLGLIFGDIDIDSYTKTSIVCANIGICCCSLSSTLCGTQ